MPIEIIFLGFAGVAAILGTWLMRRYALRRRLVDIPNSRSSHSEPTPRGGGIAIVGVFLGGFIILYALGRVPLDLFVAILGGGILVAAVSFWDDHRALPIWLRISMHFLAAGWALYWIGGMAPLDLGYVTWSWGPLRQVLGIVGLVWLINLYNFMDGIDGSAATEAIFVACAAIFLLGWQRDLSMSLGLLAACCAGFLVFNWPPARIFMGDVGSCFLGFLFGVIAIATAARQALPIWCWVILLGVFLVDATVTLLRRMLGGARWYDPHRSHAYQHALKRLGGHSRVTLAIVAINLFWLLPCAYLAARWPYWAFVLALLALAPLTVLVLCFDAGRE